MMDNNEVNRTSTGRSDLKIEYYEAEVTVEEYLPDCVDVPQFLPYCQRCSNYNRIWSCPPYDFDPVDYWKKYRTLRVIGYKVFTPEDMRCRIYPPEDYQSTVETLMLEPKKELDRSLLELEKNIPGSRALSGGSCLYCEPADCARIHGEPCRFPEKRRYSIESLGGNVGLTVTRYLHQKLEWIENGRLPEYYMIVGGLLIP